MPTLEVCLDVPPLAAKLLSLNVYMVLGDSLRVELSGPLVCSWCASTYPPQFGDVVTLLLPR